MAWPAPQRMKAAPPAFFLVHCFPIVSSVACFVTRSEWENGLAWTGTTTLR